MDQWTRDNGQWTRINGLIDLCFFIYMFPPLAKHYIMPPSLPQVVTCCAPAPGRISDFHPEGPGWTEREEEEDGWNGDKEDLGGGLGAVWSIYDFMIGKIFLFFLCKINYVSTGMSRQSFHTCSWRRWRTLAPTQTAHRALHRKDSHRLNCI